MRTWNAVASVAFLSLALGACAADPAEEPLTGAWTLDMNETAIDVRSSMPSEEGTALLASLQASPGTLTFGADGSYSWSVGGESYQGTWRARTLSTFGGIQARVTLDGADPNEVVVTFVEANRIEVKADDEAWTTTFVRP
jgi:hypothetical protein